MNVNNERKVTRGEREMKERVIQEGSRYDELSSGRGELLHPTL